MEGLVAERPAATRQPAAEKVPSGAGQGTPVRAQIGADRRLRFAPRVTATVWQSGSRQPAGHHGRADRSGGPGRATAEDQGGRQEGLGGGTPRDKDPVDTLHATQEERENYRKGLSNNPELRKKLESEWIALDSRTGPPTLDQLYDLGGRLDVIAKKAKRDASDEKALNEAAVTLVRALQAASSDPETYDMLYRELVQSYRATIASLSKGANKLALGIAAADADLAVSAHEVAAYRADITEMGVWGGLAEAETAATAVHVSCTIFTLDATGNYRTAQTIGHGQPYRGRDLLFLGNHYEMVQGAADGQPHLADHVQVATAPDGNCMWEGVLLVQSGHDLGNHRQRRINWLRQTVQQNLTAQQIETSILELLLGGVGHGVGSRMSVALAARAIETDDLQSFLEPQSIEYQAEKHQPAVHKAWKEFLAARTKDPASEETEQALAVLQAEADYLPRVKEPALPPGDTLLKDAPSDKVEARERAARLEADKGTYVVSPHNKNQVIFTREGQEYVMDRLGQLVARLLVRNISPLNQVELSQHKAMYPSASSPAATVPSSGGSGGADSTIKLPSPEMLHVQGAKPSPYLSATTSKKGALNPKGQTFGQTSTGNTAIPVTLDLAHLDPQEIRAVYTQRGMGYWMLHGFSGDKAATLKVLNAAGRQAKGQDLAKGGPSLGRKEWQALADVVRTTEVLLSDEVPRAAVVGGLPK
jgi:hypothetical protein